MSAGSADEEVSGYAFRVEDFTQSAQREPRRKEDFYVEKRMDAYIPPLYQEGAGVCGTVKLSNGSLNK